MIKKVKVTGVLHDIFNIAAGLNVDDWKCNVFAGYKEGKEAFRFVTSGIYFEILKDHRNR